MPRCLTKGLGLAGCPNGPALSYYYSLQCSRIGLRVRFAAGLGQAVGWGVGESFLSQGSRRFFLAKCFFGGLGYQGQKPDIFTKRVVFWPWYYRPPNIHLAPTPLRDPFDRRLTKGLSLAGCPNGPALLYYYSLPGSRSGLAVRFAAAVGQAVGWGVEEGFLS